MDSGSKQKNTLDIFFGLLISGFVSGIVLQSYGIHTPPMPIGIGGVLVLLLLAALVPQKSKIVFVGSALIFLGVVVGIFRADAAAPNAERFAKEIGRVVSIEGTVVDEPSVKPGGQSFTLDARDVSFSVSSGAAPAVTYGDTISVKGKLQLPENFMTDQGNEFDYISYLYKDNILYQIKNATVVVLSHNNGNWLVAHLIPLKRAVLESFHRVLPVREADLLAGLNLGVKQNIDKQFRNDLVATGTIHIIALSGYNVTVVANALRALFVEGLGFSARSAAFAGALSIILFVVMTGLQSSAIRAGIMALIGIFARGEGRTYDAFRALVLAGLLMILYDPKYLVYDVSFQLSFLATLGIIFVTPVLQQAFVRIPQKILFLIPLREALSVTLGAQLGVLPFILYKMGTLSLISLPANVFVLPAVPLAMGFGALAGLIGSFSVPLAYPISLLTYGLLRYIIEMIQLFAKVPYASIVFHSFPIALCLGMYVLLFWWLYRSWKTKKRRHTAPLP